MEKKKSKILKKKLFFKLFRIVPNVKLKVKTLCQPYTYMNPSGTASILQLSKRVFFGPYGPNRGDRRPGIPGTTTFPPLISFLEKSNL